MVEGGVRKIALAVALVMSAPAFAQNSPVFTPGNLVVPVEGCGVHGGTCTSVPNGLYIKWKDRVCFGPGANGDATAGVFYIPVGAPNTAPTPITGLDTTGKTVSQDTRDVQIYNNTLYVSVDTKGGSNSARSFIGTLGTPPATSLFNSSTARPSLPVSAPAAPANSPLLPAAMAMATLSIPACKLT